MVMQYILVSQRKMTFATRIPSSSNIISNRPCHSLASLYYFLWFRMALQLLSCILRELTTCTIGTFKLRSVRKNSACKLINLKVSMFCDLFFYTNSFLLIVRAYLPTLTFYLYRATKMWNWIEITQRTIIIAVKKMLGRGWLDLRWKLSEHAVGSSDAMTRRVHPAVGNPTQGKYTAG